jgi:uncharacterized protein (DUF362 family)
MKANNNGNQRSDANTRGLTRRDFLKLAGVTAGLVAAGCQPKWLETAAPVTVAPTARVAIAQAKTYDRVLIKQKIQDLLEGLGGLGDVVKAGAKVALKVNLTGGMHFSPPAGFTATESYVTHPEVVRALGELLIDAGAFELYIVEAVYDQESYPAWGYEPVAKGLGATLIDLNTSAPYSGFVRSPTGPDWFIYEDFLFNPILGEVDAFISVAKMKCHFNCGITLSMKNLVGLVPYTHYRLGEDHWWRSAFHGEGEQTKTRLPRVILDLNRARPIHFALIDGVMTAEGGESPRGSFHPVQPGILVAGKNPVATDAVATAAMGFDPLASPPTPPFIRSDNYLTMAGELGMGSNDLRGVEVVGAALDDVEVQFGPAWEM